MAFTKQNLISLIQAAVKNQASDIHIRTDEVPCLRIRGDLVPIQTKPFSYEDVKFIAELVLNKSDLIKILPSIKEYDGGFAIPKLCRIRFNFFRYDNKIGLIFRIINEKIPKLSDLGLPKVVSKICEQRRGLILVTGATGSGKSTTLAGMIDQINETRCDHIITVEDPVEYLHNQKKSRITHREVGRDTEDFSAALRGALRQDPDVILIGEMRDPETIQIALKAAETGHVVFSTVHTTDSVTTIGRLISMFPPEEQLEVRKRITENLHATISQRLLKGNTANGVVIAMEIMITSPGVRECILGKEDLSRIYQVIASGRGKGGNGSQTFDQHIGHLFENKVISKATALENVSSQANFIQSLTFE
ncbi:MAG: PilT/PilU family type 4a pilus ATPase [Halobacteriovoraceae bacterium]|jgi:twitching motility protein PilT|nr:PilT/PilU family type 4a pilus ATPase [Halobacteriovoraceae bacterium]MBT5095002.1 PilT/PilU family type 4a pilus ATPase [Halobacteriovoraceae bacterium]